MIEQKPWWLRPFLQRDECMTISPRIFVPDPANVPAAVLAHERVHLARQQSYGTLRWLWRYATDRHFRLGEEVLAIAAEIRASDPSLRYVIAGRYADQLSDLSYFRCATYEQALHAILEAL